MPIAPALQATAADMGDLMKTFTTPESDSSLNFESDDFTVLSGSVANLSVGTVGQNFQKRDTTSDFAASDGIFGAICLGSYIYALLYDNGAPLYKVFRYAKNNLAAGGTLMTFSGQALGTTGTSVKMRIDPSGNFYFTEQAGGSASQHIISKYTLSGTTLTFVSNTTCGSTSSNFDRFVHVDSIGNIYGFSNSDGKIRKYNSSGVLQTTSDAYPSTGGSMSTLNLAGTPMFFQSIANFLYNRLYIT